jgi:FtsZ-interacting cell division protein YlmF
MTKGVDTMAFKESEILKMMTKLDLTREEAIQLLQDDEDDVSVELTAEQKKVVKQMTQGDRKKETAPRKRERKVDDNKRNLISMLVDCLKIFTTVEVVNPEREFLFTYNGEQYKVVLSKPRAKKEG